MKKSNLVLAAVGALLIGAPSAGAETIAPDMVKIVDGKFAGSLTGTAGDAAKGRKTFSNRKLGNCLACHANKEQSEHLFHGEIGPELDGVADRYEVASLRAILINSKMVLGEDTMMPSFYRTKNGDRPMKKFAGKTILSAQDVEDVLAYLQTLK